MIVLILVIDVIHDVTTDIQTFLYDLCTAFVL